MKKKSWPRVHGLRRRPLPGDVLRLRVSHDKSEHFVWRVTPKSVCHVPYGYDTARYLHGAIYPHALGYYEFVRNVLKS